MSKFVLLLLLSCDCFQLPPIQRCTRHPGRAFQLAENKESLSADIKPRNMDSQFSYPTLDSSVLGSLDDEKKIFVIIALVPALIAYFTWEEISHFVSYVTDVYGFNGRNVDGNAFASDLLRPTINGVVVPVISISLGTLISTTVNVLRNRQVEMRALINREVCELRLLRRAVFGMFGTRQHAHRRASALRLLHDYAAQLDAESSVLGVKVLEDLQARGGIAVNELDELAEMLHGIDGAAASRQGSVRVASNFLSSLNGHRSDRVALLLTGFPKLHWVTLGALSVSLIVAFLLVSDQEVLQYLNSSQLRLLFTILVGAVSATAALCLDLADPFRGSFCINSTAAQLSDLRSTFKEDLKGASVEMATLGSLGSILSWSQTMERRRENNRHEICPEFGAVLGKTVESRDAVASFGGAIAEPSDRRGLPLRQHSPELPTPAPKSDRSSSPRYGLGSTFYFHLLTGPLDFNVRFLGDIVAWLTSLLKRPFQALSARSRFIRRRASKKHAT